MALELKKLADCKLDLSPVNAGRCRANFSDGESVVYSINVTYSDGRLTFHHEDTSTTKLLEGQPVPDGRIEEENQGERVRAAIENPRGIYRGTVEGPNGKQVPIIIRLRQGSSVLAQNVMAMIESSSGIVVPIGASILAVNGERWHYRLFGDHAGEPYNIEIENKVTPFDE